MGKADNAVTAEDSRFERFLYADYTMCVPVPFSERGNLFRAIFEDTRPEVRGSHGETRFSLTSKQIKEAIKVGAAKGYDFPQMRLAQAEMVSAQRWDRATDIFNRVAAVPFFIGSAVATVATVASVMILLTLGFSKILNTIGDYSVGSFLNDAAPVTDRPGLTYDSKRQTYFQTTGSPRQLLSWTFNEKGDLKEACVIKVRQPGDGTLAWWAVPKYDPKCISGADSSLLIKLPAHPLPRPQ